MKKVFLEAYVVSVREKNLRKAPNLVLGQFDGTSSVRTIFKGYFEDIKQHKVYNIKERERSVGLKTLKEEAPYLYGTLQAGDYGYASDILDTTTGNVNYKKKKTDTDPTPFHFEFCLPDHSKKGLMLIQKFGTLGIRTDLTHIIEERFKQHYPDFMLEINPAVPADIVNQYLKKGNIEEISFIKHSIPADKADWYAGRKTEQPGELILTVKPEKPGFFTKKVSGIVEIVKRTKKPSEVFSMPDFEYDSIKAQIEVNGRTRTIDLNNWQRLKSSFDVTSEIQRGLDGFPKESSVQNVSRQIMNDLIKDAGIIA